MKFKFLFLLILFLTPLCLALDCQYTEQKDITIQKEGVRTKDTNIFIENPLQAIDFVSGYTIGFTVKNNTSFDINAQVSYIHVSSGGPTYCLGNFPTNKDIMVPARSIYGITFSSSCSGSVNPNVTYTIYDNNFIGPLTTESFPSTITVCKLCGDQNCLNDNEECTLGTQCGGKYCIENKCSKSASNCIAGNLTSDGTCTLTNNQVADSISDSEYIAKLTMDEMANRQALTCNYTHLKSIILQKSGVRVKSTNTFIEQPITFDSFIGGYSQTFVAQNNTDFDINTRINYTNVLNSSNNPVYCSGSFPDYRIALIPAHGKYSITYPAGACSGIIDKNSVTYSIYNNIYIGPLKTESFTIQVPECNLCSGGKECLNDGIACIYGNECGGTFCVEGRCSNTENCFENNCRCEEKNKLQCPNNKKCVTKKSAGEIPECLGLQECTTGLLCSTNNRCYGNGTIQVGGTPICGNEGECITGHVNENGICSKTPEQIRQDEIAAETARIEAERLAAIAKAEEEKQLALSKAIEDKKSADKFWAETQFYFIIIIATIIVIAMLLFARPRGPVYEAVTFWRRVN
jgi:hypothetical protein